MRVALLGAGYIADTHAEVLHGLPGTAIVAVVDPARARAEALARRWRVPSVLEDPAALGGGGGVAVDVAHVLTPPALHRAAAEPLLRRGIHVLIEKPMAVDEAECEALEEAAERGGARLRVNHNSVHHPAFARLRRDLARGAVGRPRHVELVYIVQLRQLAAGQLGHWMFRSPANLLLEQAVHPLSQLEALLGPPQELVAVPEPPRRVGAEATLVTGWRIVGRAACGASFGATVVIGHSQPLWRIRVVGSDGVLESDVLRNGYQADRPTPWLEAVDDLVVGTAGGLRRAAQAAGNALAYAGGQIGARGRSDAFFASMRASVAAAHADFRARGPEPRPSPGRRLVALIGRVAAAAPAAPAPAPAPAARRGGPAAALDVLLLGGTGFIGRQLAARLVARGRRVGVLARQLDGLPAVFADPNVTLVQGDVADAALVPALVARAPVVVHLAHGGGGDWPSIERAMVGGARLVGSAAVAASARRLIFVSSIAALYLGDPGAVVDPSTPPDPEPEARAPYARGKIASEAALRALRERDGLPLTVVRPGLVVGPGTSPFHGGIGLFNRETHCIGWNGGSNPLPLVLVSDAAAALLALVERPDAAGPVHNLVGDVRLSARDYLASLARATGRPLVYHPRSAYWNAVVEGGKWAVKRAGGRRAARTTLRDLRSRGLAARFDTRRERAELAWNPVADRERFLAEAFADVV